MRTFRLPEVLTAFGLMFHSLPGHIRQPPLTLMGSKHTLDHDSHRARCGGEICSQGTESNGEQNQVLPGPRPVQWIRLQLGGLR